MLGYYVLCMVLGYLCLYRARFEQLFCALSPMQSTPLRTALTLHRMPLWWKQRLPNVLPWPSEAASPQLQLQAEAECEAKANNKHFSSSLF